MISLRFWKKFSLTQKLYYQLAIGAVLIVLTPLALGTLSNPAKTFGWYDSNWAYRIQLTLPNHSGSESNVYVSLKIDTATLITAGKLQADCGDLRFTAQDDSLLSYYIQGTCNRADTLITVNFGTYASGAVIIYYYYGNPSAANGFSGSGFSTSASNNSTTLNLQVASSADDAYQLEGSTAGIGTSNAGIGTGTAATNPNRTNGVRFQNVTIPQGTTITAANIQMASNGSWITATFHWYGNNVDNASAFSDGEALLSRAMTTTSVASSESLNLTAGTFYKYPSTGDWTAIIQEVINRSGWASNNAMAFIADGDGSVNYESAGVRYYDYGSTCNPGGNQSCGPKLSVTYNLVVPTANAEEPGPTPAPTSTPTPTTAPTTTPTPATTPTPTPAGGADFQFNGIDMQGVDIR